MIRRAIPISPHIFGGIVFLLSAGVVHAQTLNGTVLDNETNKPIAGAAIGARLKNTELPKRATSDSLGRFVIELASPDTVTLTVQSAGYKDLLTDVSVSVGGLSVIIRLGREAAPLEPIEVVGVPRVRKLEMFGFYERQKEGLGAYVMREQIEQRKPRRTSEVLSSVQGIRLRRLAGPGGKQEPVMRAGLTMGALRGGSDCLPKVFVDGMAVREGGQIDPRNISNFFTPLDDLVSPDDIEAIEIYRAAAQLPTQFSGATSACGVIAIWTR